MAEAEVGGGGGWRCSLTVSSLYPSKERCLRSPAAAEGVG